MIRFTLRQYSSLALLALFFSVSCPGVLRAQSAPPKTPKMAGRKLKKIGAKGANLKTGTFLSLDPDAMKITLKTAAGETLSYSISDTTHFYHAKKEADASTFKPGEAVTLKLRKVRNKATFFVFELDDTESYDWLTDLRKNPKVAVIKEMGDAVLNVTIDGADAVYTLSDKTRWNRSGKEVSDTAFKAGDKVVIIPRSLPSGAVMARVVADNLKDAELSKAEGAGILSGVFKSLDTAAQTITFVMMGDETRAIPYNAQTEVRLRSKTAKLSTLKAGQHITVHVTHEDDGKDLATRITIEQTKKTAAKT